MSETQQEATSTPSTTNGPKLKKTACHICSKNVAKSNFRRHLKTHLFCEDCKQWYSKRTSNAHHIHHYVPSTTTTNDIISTAAAAAAITASSHTTGDSYQQVWVPMLVPTTVAEKLLETNKTEDEEEKR